MRQLCFSTFLWITGSFFLALLLSIVPLPPALAIFYPQWIPLVLIYWTLRLPEHICLTIVWVLGLLIDVLYGNYLGEHSFALCAIVFLVYRFHWQFRMFPLPQQILFVFLFLIVYQGILVWIQALLGFPVELRWMWASLLASVCLWPFIKKMLNVNSLEIP